MPIYEYQGKHYDIDTNDAADAKRRILASLQPSAQSVVGGTEASAAKVAGRAALADTVLNAITGTYDLATRAIARPYYTMVRGMSPADAEQAAARSNLPKDIVGRALGVAGTQQYENAPLRRLGTAVSETVGENVINPIAQATGLPQEYVGDVVGMGTAAVAPAVGPAARGVATAGRAVGDVVGGAAGRATGYIAKPGETPTGYQVPSSRIKLGETFIPAKEMAALERGMPISEGAIRPIRELAPGPVLALSGGEIPVAGRAARAFGERVGETYANPYTAAADIGSMFLTGGIPVLTAGRGALGLAQAGADAFLSRKGFRPLTPEQQNLLNQGTNPFYTPPTAKVPGPVVPPPVPAAAPAAPANVPLLPYNPTPPTMYVAPEGVASTNMRAANMAGIQQKYPPGGIPTAAAMQAAAAQRVVGAPPISGPVVPRTGDLNTILESIRNKNRPVAAPAPAAPAPAPATIGPVAPTELLAAPAVTQPLTAAQIRRDLPRLPRETSEQFEARVQQALAAQPQPATPAPAPAAVVKAQTPTEITEAIRTTGRGAVNSKDKVVSVDRDLYNEAAGRYGVTLDWTQAPDVKGMSLGDARAAIDKFVTKQVKGGVGPFERGPQMRTLQRQAEAELGITGKEELTPEMRKRLGMPETSTSAPTASPAISPALQAMLDKQKGSGKYKPPGVNEMITNEPSAVQKIKNATWDTPEDFAQKSFMHDLGLNPGQEFIAKTKTQNGSIIRAVEKGIDSTAAQFPDGNGYMIRKNIKTGDITYDVFDNTNSMKYDIQRSADGVIDFADIYTVDKNGDRVATIATKDEAGWWVIEKDKTGYTMFNEKEISTTKSKGLTAKPATKEKLKALKEQDWDALLQSWQDRIDLIKGK